MKPKPDGYGIMFKAEMVRAILAGRKFQTRRIMRAQFLCGDTPQLKTVDGCVYAECACGDSLRCPYGGNGGKLWARETWRSQNEQLFYRADREHEAKEWKWRSAMLMPRWASRITLENITIRVERIEDISEEDALAEGIEDFSSASQRLFGLPEWRAEDLKGGAREAFLQLFHGINKKKNSAANPWVWVIGWEKTRTTSRRAGG